MTNSLGHGDLADLPRPRRGRAIVSADRRPGLRAAIVAGTPAAVITRPRQPAWDRPRHCGRGLCGARRGRGSPGTRFCRNGGFSQSARLGSCWLSGSAPTTAGPGASHGPAGARRALRVRLPARPIGAGRADHHAPSHAAVHRRVNRHTSRQPHAEGCIARRHQILGDRLCRVVSADALAKRRECLGADGRGACHGERRRGCCHNPHGAMPGSHKQRR
jgi:hypothetical protein